MAEAVTSITASTYSATTGLGIRYVGNWVFAYSGAVQDAASSAPDTDCLDFTSGSGIIVARVNWSTNYAGNADMHLLINLNDIAVYQSVLTTTNTVQDQPIDIIIPPFTRFNFKWGIVGQTKDLSVMLTGRVYGAE